MSMKLLKNGTVIAFDDATESVKVLQQTSILIEDDHIVAIINDLDNVGIPSDTEILDVTDKIVSPGFVNTHTHMWQSVFRTLAPSIVFTQYFNRLSQLSVTVNESFTPEELYISCLQGYLEGMNRGVTSFVDHAHNNWSEKILEAGYDAATDSGARVWWCCEIMDRDSFTAQAQRDSLRRIALRANPDQPVNLGLSLDMLARSPKDAAMEIHAAKSLASELDAKVLTLHHIGSQSSDEPTSPVAICSQNVPAIGLPVIFSHASFLTPNDISALRDHNLFASITPEFDCHFGSGQVNGHSILDQASIGTATNWTFSGDLISQTRLWLQMTRHHDRTTTSVDRQHPPKETPVRVEEAFLLATRQGSRALRNPDIGVLRVGAKADIVVFNGDSPNMLGWTDPVAAVILHANAGDVEHVLVNGEFRKRDFQLILSDNGWDMAEIRKRFLEASKRLQSILKTPSGMTQESEVIGK